MQSGYPQTPTVLLLSLCAGAPRIAPLWWIVLQRSRERALALLRLDWEPVDVDGTASRQHRGPRTRPLFDMGTSAAALRLRNTRSAHRITGELVDSKVPLRGAPTPRISGQRFDGSGNAPPIIGRMARL